MLLVVFSVPVFRDYGTALGVVLLLVGPAVPFFVWWFTLRKWTVRVAHIAEDTVILDVPSARFARALGVNVPVEAVDELDLAAQRTQEAPERAICAAHAGTLARWACGRCGSFFCPLCARYPLPGDKPLCAACFPAER